MAGFRDKESQLVPEADPPLGQSSSREQSVHGREVPDENRNVKSKAKSALLAVKMENKCANCLYDFANPSKFRKLEVVIPAVSSDLSAGNATKTVNVKEAFEYVFNVQTQDGQTEVAVCSECAGYLAGAYGLVSKLSQLKNSDSYFDKRIKQQQDLIKRKSGTGKKAAGVKKAANKSPSVTVAKKAQYKPKMKKDKKEKGNKATKAAAAKSPAAAAAAAATPAPATPKTPKGTGRKPRIPDSTTPANLREFIDPRPSRNAKLTAMVLMNNSFDAAVPAAARGTPKSSPPAAAPAPASVEAKGAKKPAGAKQPRKKKAEEAPAGPPPKKSKTAVERPSSTTSAPVKARGKKAAAAAVVAAPEVPLATAPVTPLSTPKAPKGKTPRSETAKASGKKSAKKETPKPSTSTESLPATAAAAEPTKGKKGGKGKGKSLEDAVAASKLSSELKIPSVTPPNATLDQAGKKPKKEKAPKKPKIMLSKATSTKKVQQSEQDSAKEVTPGLPASGPQEAKKEKKKKAKKSEGGVGTGEHVLDLSLKIPQIPVPGSSTQAAETPKQKKPKGKKAAETPSLQPQFTATSTSVESQKQRKPKKPKVPKVFDAVSSTSEALPLPPAGHKKPKKGKSQEGNETQAASSASTSTGQVDMSGNKASTQKFICNSCGKDFTARWNLRRHDLLVHELSTSPPFTCVFCKQEFPARKALLEHRMSGPCATGPSTTGGTNTAAVSRPAVAVPIPKKLKASVNDVKETVGTPKTPKQPKGSAKEPKESSKPKGTTKGSEQPKSQRQAVGKPKKEKQERKRKAGNEDSTKPTKKPKKSADTAAPGSNDIPSNVISGTDASSKEGSAGAAQSSSTVSDQNGPIASSTSSKDLDRVDTTKSGGTSSTVNHAESVTSNPSGGDTAGVGA